MTKSDPQHPIDLKRGPSFDDDFSAHGKLANRSQGLLSPRTAKDEHSSDPITLTPTSLSTREARQVIAAFPTSPSNPLNWSGKKKWAITATLALTGFISTAGSSVGVPGMHSVMEEFGVKNEKIGVLISSAYVLGLGFGPFVFAPISELYGRQVAYFSSQFLYVIFSLGTGFSKNMPTLIILRFLCGCWGSPPPSLGVATCADIFAPHERGKPISLYALGPMGGPVIGNMVGYWLLFGGWRWAYYFITILSALNLTLLCLILRETYAPATQKILTHRATHPPAPSSRFGRYVPVLSWMPAMVSRADAKAVYGRAFSRPPRLLFTNPVAFGFSMYYGYVYGIIYLFIIGLPLLYGKAPYKQDNLFSYQWPLGTMGLAYISLGLGFLIAAAVTSTFQDRIYKHLSKVNGDKGQPEYRLVMTQIGMCVMPLGLFVFAWTANAEVHWIAPCIGQAITGLGLMLAFNTLQNFFVDAFYPYSGAAIAGATATRSVMACVLPVFVPEMFSKLGWGWGGTLIACVALVGVPGPIVMFFRGQRLRERFAFQG
ncbi:hypothetical protein L198_03945 [Cryptococcus wingfieldii CBS 7118]|uniref:Major facilitator superfamily (MFS) profile domain-containing protein n=1 Tax=Cryptococcus wingfieldii CBS 7118 TaxID=1295528 RepID=A0A1E3JBU1_9TREE|nr:hypothetical protein L198_03945 [Cryptococcus wingfieldii CBS 7118]ODN97381.1 hypothetical protein L198_03945 [Cryptococcus wingfieldii CBS 7118]